MATQQEQKLDLGPLDQILATCAKGLEATIPLLQGIQTTYGYLPMEALVRASAGTGIPESHLFGVATFYKQFRLRPVGKNMIKVCLGTACHVQGGQRVHAVTRESLEIGEREDTTSDALFTVEPVACLGCCSLAPVVMVNETTHGRLDAPAVRRLMKKLQKSEKKDA
ncbi:MAG: NAD(P)H-dependent oxidoreductase subunit E [Polyangia bacterium]|jgi:NADH:ubiquinone oxidoreductase subunit E|nr:NAD(P)H-dependent oxidoreductase subunit E [Polyangia bacterium]